MTDIERWMDTHEAELRALADRAGAHQETVQLVAVLVLNGLSDDEIYENLRDVSPSWDGQSNPLADAPDLVDELRRLVSAP